MKKNKYSYFKDDIRKMLLLYAFFPALILTFLLLFMFWGYWKIDVVRTSSRENDKLSASLLESVESYSEFIEDLSDESELYRRALSNGERADVFNRLYAISNSIGKSADLYIFDGSHNPIMVGRQNIPYYLSGQSYSNWGIFHTMKVSQDPVSIRVLEEYEGNMHLIMGKKIMEEGEIIGYIVITMDSRQFQIELSELSSQSIITDKSGKVFIANNYAFLDNLSRVSLEERDFEGTVKKGPDSYYLTSNSILDNRLHIYSIKLISNQMQFFISIGIILILVFGLIILLVLYSTKKLAIKKTEDFYKIMRAFDEVQSGDLSARVSIFSNDEFQTIGDSFNEMVENLQKEISRNQEMTERLSMTQIRHLRSQFNPHFLYNTLDNIRFMVKFNPEDAGKMILSLSTLLRYSLDNATETVPLLKDMESTENYLKIMKFRYGDRLTYSIDIPADVENIALPKLIIQPMIENAVKYGSEGRMNLHIRLSAFRDGGNVKLICEDNGVGMDEEMLANVNSQLEKEVNDSGHFGLYNIHRRLRLKYGEASGVSIESARGVGTKLMIVIPLMEENQNIMEGAAE
ncbi:histidine kinase [Proteiniclasticum sp.]|uniref:sensor histidine kinase n=1 Tax=Proteiniclasticum sp. TaxID=2053595 RepID=UPI0028A00D9C|nr:histidine kinase [Proteiniclasticum sp.]